MGSVKGGGEQQRELKFRNNSYASAIFHTILLFNINAVTIETRLKKAK